jgi:DMSO/TMAO reductase YedYZ molybdopterin-dependent catalytic subunit
MLADRLDGEPIDVTQGGPWRLVIPEERLCNSVKWVDAVEFSLDTPNNSAARIAQARTRAREKRDSTS